MVNTHFMCLLCICFVVHVRYDVCICVCQKHVAVYVMHVLIQFSIGCRRELYLCFRYLQQFAYLIGTTACCERTQCITMTNTHACCIVALLCLDCFLLVKFVYCIYFHGSCIQCESQATAAERKVIHGYIVSCRQIHPKYNIAMNKADENFFLIKTRFHQNRLKTILIYPATCDCV